MDKPALLPSESTLRSDSSGDHRPLPLWLGMPNFSSREPSRRTAWQLPSDPTERNFVSDTAAAGRLSSAAHSWRGSSHEENQDAFLLLPAPGIFALADGISGLPNGAMAARIATTTAASLLQTKVARQRPGIPLSRAELQSWLTEAVAAADAAVRHAGDELGRPMGCTLDLALVRGDVVALAHVGDARIYRLRDGKLDVLTRDHTMAEGFIDRGMDRQIALSSAYAHWLSNAVGTGEAPVAAVGSIELKVGDRLLLCSDGVHGELAPDFIQSKLGGTAAMAAWSLVKQVADQGGYDDATAVVIARR